MSKHELPANVESFDSHLRALEAQFRSALNDAFAVGARLHVEYLQTVEARLAAGGNPQTCPGRGDLLAANPHFGERLAQLYGSIGARWRGR